MTNFQIPMNHQFPIPNIKGAFSGKKALITFITAGDPDLKTTEKLIIDLQNSGADIIEIGIPFSDPLADGPIIQASHQRALRNNVSLADVFKLVKRVRPRVPIVFMLGANLIESYGSEKFYTDCGKYGVAGVIVPDLPPEEKGLGVGKGVGGEAAKVDNIFLIAPTTSDERIKKIVDASSGFIYLVSSVGITGKRAKSSDTINEMVQKIRKVSDLPIAVGFGISSPKQAKESVKYADGVIVGSALVDLIAKKQYKKVSALVKSLRRAIDVK
jgi:tryptophan synthase alpha chain